MKSGYQRQSRRERVVIALIVLFLGLLSVGVDDLREHSPSTPAVCNHSEYNGAASHLVAEYGKQAPPCNACFFNGLFGHVLLPPKDTLSADNGSVPHLKESLAFAVHCSLEHEVNRGPPSSL